MSAFMMYVHVHVHVYVCAHVRVRACALACQYVCKEDNVHVHFHI